MYHRMARIRTFEQRASQLYRDTEIPGFLHLSIGQEATAVGACWPLTETDVVTSNHRGHGHCLAKGLDAPSMFAELMGKETGTCSGRGGSMHIADPARGVFGANGIVGAGLPIAVGAATAKQLTQSGGVVVAFFGDGAVSQGTFHESVNLAAVWQLPIVFLCENNHYAEFSPASSQTRGSLAAKAAGYGVEYAAIDGNDVEAVAALMDAQVARLRCGGGPILVEAATYRWHGHYEGDPERYRTAEELARWKGTDPLTVARDRLVGRGIPESALQQVDDQVAVEIEDSVAFARRSQEPAASTLRLHVEERREPVVEAAPEQGETFRTMDAVRLALEHEMEHDPTVFIAGIDVGAGGNVFGLTRGLAERFPGRVRDTPISENAVIGTAVGSAMAGMRPVVEVMYMDFIGVCFDQLLNQAAKLRFMTGGRASLPLVVRTQFGAGRSSGSQHSQSLEALLAHVPGLSVVMPSTPAETYGLLRAAIRDPNPVVFVENRLQYGLKGPKPQADYQIPMGKANVIRPGTDITLVTYSRMVQEGMRAAETLAGEGIAVEVIDLRSISPLDRETVLNSLHKTNRMVIAHEAVRDFGVGAELAAMAVDEGFWSLDAPVARVGAAYMPAPYAPSLERLWLPDATSIEHTLRRVAGA